MSVRVKVIKNEEVNKVKKMLALFEGEDDDDDGIGKTLTRSDCFCHMPFIIKVKITRDTAILQAS